MLCHAPSSRGLSSMPLEKSGASPSQGDLDNAPQKSLCLRTRRAEWPLDRQKAAVMNLSDRSKQTVIIFLLTKICFSADADTDWSNASLQNAFCLANKTNNAAAAAA